MRSKPLGTLAPSQRARLRGQVNSQKAHTILIAQEVRLRLRHYINVETAKVANLTVADLRQVASGFYPLRDWQVRALARHMRLLDAELVS